MARSHPPTLLRLTERTLREECRLERGERILVAVSGGGDSSALLHVLSSLAPRLGVSLVAHGVDHGLRRDAAAELDLAERLAATCGVPFGRTSVQVEKGGNLQARARLARRAALESAALRSSATRIATAHHADDRAETVLLRLLHGASSRALAVLPAAEGAFIRPFIRARKSDVVSHLARHEIAFAEDPSNSDRQFLRVRVRLEVLPLLADLSPGIVNHLTSLADELGEPAAPRVLDDSGAEVPLRRAHVEALRRALRLGRRARIRLSDDRELEVNPKSGEVRVNRAKALEHTPRNPTGPSAHGRLARRASRASREEKKKGGAKPGKSG